MKLRSFAAIAAVCVTLAACDRAPKDGAEVGEESIDESALIEEMNDHESLSEITDEELEMFADLSSQFLQINQTAQGEMMGAVEQAGMQVGRYTEIQQLLQMPDKEVDASGEELDRYNEANENIEKIQNRIQEEMIDILDGAGLSEQWYENMVMKIQADEELLAKYQKMVEE